MTIESNRDGRAPGDRQQGGAPTWGRRLAMCRCLLTQQQGLGLQLQLQEQLLPQLLPQLSPQQQNRIISRMMIQQQFPPPKKPLLHIREPPTDEWPRISVSVHRMRPRLLGALSPAVLSKGPAFSGVPRRALRRRALRECVWTGARKRKSVLPGRAASERHLAGWAGFGFFLRRRPSVWRSGGSGEQANFYRFVIR